MMHEVRRRAYEFDVIHFHVDLVHFPFFEDIARHTVTTLHGRLDLKDLPDAYRRWQQYPLVSVSDHQRKAAPARQLDLDSPSWRAGGPIPLRRRAGWRLPRLPRSNFAREAAGPGDRDREARGAQAQDRGQGRRGGQCLFRPRSSSRCLPTRSVEFVGEISDAEKSPFLGNATALLFPIDWPEPFGLVMIEAMACGTPVVAWRCGSVPEIVDEGVTGFVVSSEEEAAAAVVVPGRSTAA